MYTKQQPSIQHKETTMSILTVADRKKMTALMQTVITEDGELVGDRELIRSACAQTLFILTDGEEGDECEYED
jgi:predicted ATP-dependent serine protease